MKVYSVSKLLLSLLSTLFFTTDVCASGVEFEPKNTANEVGASGVEFEPKSTAKEFGASGVEFEQPKSTAEEVVHVIDDFKASAPTGIFAFSFFSAKKSQIREEVCRDISEHVASKVVSVISQKMNTTITIDVGMDGNVLVFSTEAALSLIWGEDGQFACSENVGIGFTIGLLGVGVTLGVSISPKESLGGWDSVGASWKKPVICLSFGYSKVAGIAGTVAIDPSRIDPSKALAILSDTFDDTLEATDFHDMREIFVEALTAFAEREVGAINVGIEFNLGVDLIDVTLLAGATVPDVQVVACTERLTYCDGDRCDEKLMVGKRGDACQDKNDCAVEFYCNRGACYDGSNGDRCSIHQDCLSNVCYPFTKECTSGLRGSICLINRHCNDGFTCRGFQCSHGLNGDKCTLHLDCDSNICYPATKKCSSGAEGASCGLSRHCKAGNYCKSGKCYDGTNGDPCVLHSNCDSNICYPATKRCSSGAEGTSCGLSMHCKAGNYCKSGKCYDGTNGDPCVLHSNCDSKICYPATKRCSAGTHGSTCTLRSHCKSGYYCNRWRCYNGRPGDRCSIHRDCQSNNCPWRTKVCK